MSIHLTANILYCKYFKYIYQQNVEYLYVFCRMYFLNQYMPNLNIWNILNRNHFGI